MMRCIAAILLLTARCAYAQDGFTPLRADGNGIASLARITTVRVHAEPLGDALRRLTHAAGIDLYAPGTLPALGRRVSLDADTLSLGAALLTMARDSGVELIVSAVGPTMVARATHSRGDSLGVSRHEITGSARDSTGAPIAGVRVEGLDAANRVVASAITNSDGVFRMPLRDHATASVQARRLGYAPLRVLARDEATIDLTLRHAAVPLSAIVVTPGFYGMMEQRVDAPQTLTREQIRAAPQIGEDLFRSVNRLPGVSANDFSAAFRVRGGANREVYSTLDGVELLEPFHLKDFDGALSIIDVAAISGLDLTTGGFGARYGDHLTGVMSMRIVDPPAGEAARSELALTLTTMRATSHGSFGGDQGNWLVSARRGFLEYALRAAGERDNLNPRYYDVLGRSSYRLGERGTISLHVLHAGDQLTYQDDDDQPRIMSAYTSSYAWATAQLAVTPSLSTETVLSLGHLSWERNGTRTSSFDGVQDLTISDNRDFTNGAIRTEWSWTLSPNALLAWGGELRSGRASYQYQKNERTLVAVGGQAQATFQELTVATAPTGTTSGAFATLKVQPADRVTMDLGGRVDRQSYTGEHQLSPRIGVAFAATDRTTIRAAWGRYSQPEGLYELQTQDSVTRFDSAELAEQRVAGIEQRFSDGLSGRIEAYERRVLRVRPRYVSVDNSVDVFPEIEPDRVLLAPSSSVARGVEFLLSRSPGHRITWSASYAYATSNDIVGNVTVPRTLDQRHTVTLDLGWHPSPKWQFSGAWLYHSGWPTTAFSFALDTLSDNRILAQRVYAARNAERLPAYHRLDLRVTRDVVFGTQRLSIFGDLFNVYDRANARAYDQVVSVFQDKVIYTQRVDKLMPRLPSFGVSWEF
jgi:hypothetical protein